MVSDGDNLVSVIVPTYLEEKCIEGCLRSVKNQDFSSDRIEIIVVDSNSPDKTRDIAKKYAHKVINIKERGVGKARNTGVKHARGEILLFLDADTLLHPEFVRELTKTFRTNDLVCVSGSLRALSDDGLKEAIYGYFHFKILNKIMKITSLFNFPLFVTNCCSCRRWAFEKIGGFDESLAIGEDLKFSLKIRKCGKCSVNKRSLAFASLRRTEKMGIIGGLLIFFRNYVRIVFLKKKPWIDEFPHVE